MPIFAWTTLPSESYRTISRPLKARCTKSMKRAAPGPIDCVLDILPPMAGTKAVRAAAMTVREYGRVVLMGGVGILGGDDFALPYPWIMRNCISLIGQWMYPPEANVRLVAARTSASIRQPLEAYFGRDLTAIDTLCTETGGTAFGFFQMGSRIHGFPGHRHLRSAHPHVVQGHH